MHILFWKFEWSFSFFTNCEFVLWHTWRLILAQTLVKVTHGPEMCRPWAGLWLFYTFRTGCHRKSDNRLDIGPILGQVRLKVGKFEQLIKAAVVGPALDRCKRRYWPNNNSWYFGCQDWTNIVPYYQKIIYTRRYYFSECCW